MKRRRYDPNPDVDEVLHYSSAGAAAEARREAELDARLGAASREVNARALAEWEAKERAERYETIRYFVIVALTIGAMFLGFWRWVK